MNLTHQIDSGCNEEGPDFEYDLSFTYPILEGFSENGPWESMTFSYEVYPGFVPVGIFAFCGGAFFPTGRPPDFN